MTDRVHAMTRRVHADNIAELRRIHAERREEIRARLAEFRAVPAARYFYELCYCLMTPQSSAAHCMAVLEALEAADFAGRDIDPAPLLHPAAPVYVRFHRTKARRLAAFKQAWPEVRAMLASDLEPRAMRERLVAMVSGLGYKEASHFLRNIGKEGVVIIDRHILRNFLRMGIIDAIPASISPRAYLALEWEFEELARAAGMPAEELDLVLWSRETGRVLK